MALQRSRDGTADLTLAAPLGIVSGKEEGPFRSPRRRCPGIAPHNWRWPTTRVGSGSVRLSRGHPQEAVLRYPPHSCDILPSSLYARQRQDQHGPAVLGRPHLCVSHDTPQSDPSQRPCYICLEVPQAVTTSVDHDHDTARVGNGIAAGIEDDDGLTVDDGRDVDNGLSRRQRR